MLTRSGKENDQASGFTLIELIVVISVMSILALILVPSVAKSVESAKKKVCGLNRMQLQQMYEGYLEEGTIEHSVDFLNQYIEEVKKDVCPAGGQIIYKDGEIKCSRHAGEEQGEKDVPYL